MDSIRIRIPDDIFSPAENVHFEGSIEPFVLKVGFDKYVFSDCLTWKTDITNTGDAFVVQGSVIGVAKSVCARCLKDIQIPVNGEIEGYFLISEEGSHVPDDMDEDEFDILPDDHTIDMDVLINAAILCEMPLIPLCDENCKGLCPHCGADLNITTCDCAKTEIDDDFEPEKNPFGALRDFRFEEN